MDKRTVSQSIFEKTLEGGVKTGLGVIAPELMTKHLKLFESAIGFFKKWREDDKKAKKEAKDAGVSQKTLEEARKKKEAEDIRKKAGIEEKERKKGFEAQEEFSENIKKSTKAIVEQTNTICEGNKEASEAYKKMGEPKTRMRDFIKSLVAGGEPTKIKDIRSGAIKSVLGAFGLAGLEEHFDISGKVTEIFEKRKEAREKAKREEKEAALIGISVEKYREKLEEQAKKEREERAYRKRKELGIRTEEDIRREAKEAEEAEKKEEARHERQLLRETKIRQKYGMLPVTPETKMLTEGVTMGGEKVDIRSLPKEMQEKIIEALKTPMEEQKSVLSEVAEHTEATHKEVKEVKEILSKGIKEEIEPITPALEEQKSVLDALQKSAEKADKETEKAKKEKGGGIFGSVLQGVLQGVLQSVLKYALPVLGGLTIAALFKKLMENVEKKTTPEEKKRAQEELYGYEMPTHEEAWKAKEAKNDIEWRAKLASMKKEREGKTSPPSPTSASLEPTEVPSFVPSKGVTPEDARRFSAAQRGIYARKGRPLVTPESIPEVIPTPSPSALAKGTRPPKAEKIPIVIPPSRVSDPPRPAQKSIAIDDLNIAVANQMLFW
jgi:hypothetical protein